MVEVPYFLLSLQYIIIIILSALECFQSHFASLVFLDIPNETYIYFFGRFTPSQAVLPLQRALNAQTYPPFLCIFMRFAVIFSRYIHNCRIYLHKYYVIIFIASRVRCRNGHYLIFVEHVNVSFVNKHFLSLTVIKIT